MPRQVEGYAILTDPDVKTPEERKSYVCCHCNAIIFWKTAPLADNGGYCMKCDDLICGKEGCMARCWPFEKELLYREGQRQLWQSFRKV